MGLPAVFVVGDIDEAFVCNICQELAKDAVFLSCCSTQLFCRACLEQWLAHSMTCPTHQGPTSKADIADATTREAAIRSLPTQCRTPGCSWTGTMSGVEAHMEETGHSDAGEAQASDVGALSRGVAGVAIGPMLPGETRQPTQPTQRAGTASPLGKLKHMGLSNQGATCYLNSLLQSLFMTPEFRNAVLAWNPKVSEERREKSIGYQLCRLFVLMLDTDKRTTLSTQDLTKSFGWDRSDTFEQHDVQELCRVLFDALGSELKGSSQEGLIERLYQGKMMDFVHCLECGYEPPKEAGAYEDVALAIRVFGSDKPMESLREALDKFVEVETLDGDNQWHCEKCDKKVDIEKGLRFLSFPYILTFQLKRFDFDMQYLKKVKVHEKVTFDTTMDLADYLRDGRVRGADGEVIDGPGGCQYELFSVMVQSGGAHGGHYYAYIRDFTDNCWYDFDDSSVTPIEESEIEKTFGQDPASTRARGYYYSGSTTAYMLFYRRVDPANERFITRSTLPEHAKELADREDALLEKRLAAQRLARSMIVVDVFYFTSANERLEAEVQLNKTDTCENLLSTMVDAIVPPAQKEQLERERGEGEGFQLWRYSHHRDTVDWRIILDDPEANLVSVGMVKYGTYLLSHNPPPLGVPPVCEETTFYNVAIVTSDGAIGEKMRVGVAEQTSAGQLPAVLAKQLGLSDVYVIYVQSHSNIPCLLPPSDQLSRYKVVFGGDDLFVLEAQDGVPRPTAAEFASSTVALSLGKLLNEVGIRIILPEETPKTATLNLRVDRRTKLAAFKASIEELVGLPASGFTLHLLSSAQSDAADEPTYTECNVLDASLTANYIRDGAEVYVRVGTALNIGEYHVQLHLYKRGCEDEGFVHGMKKLCTAVVAADQTILETKQALVPVLADKGIVAPADRLRLREKAYFGPRIVLMDDARWKTDVYVYDGRKMVVEVLEQEETKKAPTQLLLVARMWKRDQYVIGEPEELCTGPAPRVCDVIAQLAERTGIAANRLEILKAGNGGDTLLSVFEMEAKETRYKWTSAVEESLHDWPWYLVDGYCLYYRDIGVDVKALTPEEDKALKAADRKRREAQEGGSSSYSVSDWGKEKALKITVQDRDTVVEPEGSGEGASGL